VPVYVDKPIYRVGRMIMCHMVADTLDELHSMADKIGVDRRWFQSEASFPHYDICKSKRSKAVIFEAVEVGRRELVEIIRRLRGDRKEPELTRKNQRNTVLTNQKEKT